MKTYFEDRQREAYIAAVGVFAFGMGALLYYVNGSKSTETTGRPENNIEAILAEEPQVRRIDNGILLRRRKADYKI